MAEQWYYRLFGEQFGPMPIEKLKELADAGTIQAFDQVRSAASSDWVDAASVAALGLSTSERGSVATLEEADISDFAIATPQAAPDDWYYKMGDHELGPVGFDELLKFAEQEQLSAEDEVKLGGNGKWRRVGSIGKLMAALPYKPVEKTIVRGALKSASDPVIEKIDKPAATVAPFVATPAPAAAPVPDPDVTYRVAYEQAKAKLTESMLAQADAAFKVAEDQAKSHVAWASAANVDRSWWGWASGVEFGPVEFSQVFGLAKSGQLKPTDFVRNGSHGQFVPSQNVPGLYKAVELISRANDARNLARAQAQAAASLALPPPVAPTALVKAAELAAAPAPAPAPTPRSNPVVDTVRSQPASDPQMSTPRSNPEIDRIPRPEPEVSRPQPAASNYGYSSSPMGSYSSSSSSMSTYGSSRPAPIPARSYPKKSSMSDSTWFSDMLENMKEPKAIGAVCALLLVGLIFGWQFLPKSRGDDIKRYQALKQMLDEIKTKRASSPAELLPMQEKLKKLGKQYADELKSKASPSEPAKQCLLWASRDEIPRMITAGLILESQAEKSFEQKLKEAAIELGLEKRPPIDMALLQARANDD